jgi:hypothetical protein
MRMTRKGSTLENKREHLIDSTMGTHGEADVGSLEGELGGSEYPAKAVLRT